MDHAVNTPAGEAVTDTAQAEEFKRLMKKDVAFGSGGVEFVGLEDAYRFAKLVAQSSLGNRESAQDVLVKIQAGMELGMPPLMAYKHVHIIKGVISLSVEFCAAVVERHKALAPGTKIRVAFAGERMSPDWTCTVTSTPRGGEPIVTAARWGDFKHLSGGQNWRNYPERMLKSRAVGYHIKDHYAAQLGGISVAEDVEDYRQTRGRTVRDTAPQAATTDPLAQRIASIEPENAAPMALQAPDEQETAADKPEIDPETGEVIPDHVGRSN